MRVPVGIISLDDRDTFWRQKNKWSHLSLDLFRGYPNLGNLISQENQRILYILDKTRLFIESGAQLSSYDVVAHRMIHPAYVNRKDARHEQYGVTQELFESLVSS